MSMQMMAQRKEISQDIERVVEFCLSNIRNKGVIDIPSIIIDLETLSIANRRYFEENGFCFEPSTRMENGRVRYYAIMRPIYNGVIANCIREKMIQAQKDYNKRQLQIIENAYKESLKEFGPDLARVPIDMRKIILENKIILEEHGFYFQPRDNEGLCWMKMRV